MTVVSPLLVIAYRIYEREESFKEFDKDKTIRYITEEISKRLASKQLQCLALPFPLYRLEEESESPIIEAVKNRLMAEDNK